MSNTTTFADVIDHFGVVTVMNAKLYPLDTENKKGYNSYGGEEEVVVKPDHFDRSAGKVLYIDTLKVANITQEGPTKTITGGQYSNPLIKWGKTTTAEITDALGNSKAIARFMGAEVVSNRISINAKFPGAFAMEGENFLIDAITGEEVKTYIFIPQFIPDATFNLTQDAEGDATVFEMNGTLGLTKIMDQTYVNGDYVDTEGTERKIFYEIREESFFPAITEATATTTTEAD